MTTHAWESKRRVFWCRRYSSENLLDFFFFPCELRHSSHDFDPRTYRKESIKINRHSLNDSCDSAEEKNARCITERHISDVWLNTKYNELPRSGIAVISSVTLHLELHVIDGAWSPRAQRLWRHILASALPAADGLSSAVIVCMIAKKSNKINIV